MVYTNYTMTTQEDCGCVNSKCFENEEEECPCGEDCGCDDGDCCYTDNSDDDDFDDENNSILRGKWIYDESTSIDEMIECLQREIRLLTDLKTDGWYLTRQVEDDYAFIRRDVVTPPTPDAE